MKITLDEIIAFIKELVEICRDLSNDQLKDRIRNPRPLDKLRLERRVMLSRNIRLSEWWGRLRDGGGQTLREITIEPWYECCCELTDEELQAIVELCKR